MAKSKRQSVNKQDVLRLIKGQRMANAELKGYVNTSTGNTVSATGTVYNITTPIVQGDTYSTRDGAQLNLVKVTFKMNTTCVVSTGATRIVIFQDKHANGILPAVTDILDTATYIAGVNPYRIDAEMRFKVLHDKTYIPSIAGEQQVYDQITFAKKLLKKVSFIGSTNVVTSNGKNTLYMLVIGAATNLLDYSFKMDFIDQ